MAGNYYKKVAATYDRQWQTYTDRTLNKMMEYLPDSLTGKVILDVGCGTGELIKRMLVEHPEIKQIVGYDPSEEMLQQAQYKIQSLPDELNQKVVLQRDDEYNTTFDLIVTSSVLHYLSQPQTNLEQLSLLLRPQGRIILLDYTKAGWLARYFEWAIKWIDQQHEQAYFPTEMKELVTNAGFRVDRSQTFRINFFWKGFIVRAYY
uniref:Class I SAM-dependent methyltransferase n=1 Tax=Roseihalotalea indica TaxID=2867963 RepID=A0AA49GRH7_9BACT|nr:class I SAM-dependent methyltransferase [Tunicatimonas sp. TK19036]